MRNISFYTKKMLEKREREDGIRSAKKTFSVYDMAQFDYLVDLAKREKTTVSSILNNLYEDFLLKFNGPQKILDDFKPKYLAPTVDSDTSEWLRYLNTLNSAQYEEFHEKFKQILRLVDQRYDELQYE